MKRLFFSLMMVLMIGSLSTGVFGGEGSAKEKMIRGNISSVDCNKGTITLSGVRDLRSDKESPDVTLRVTKETILTGAKECKEIQEGSSLLAAYTENDEGNVVTELMLVKKKIDVDRRGRIEEELQKKGLKIEDLQKDARQKIGASRRGAGEVRDQEGSDSKKERNESDK